MSTSAGRSVPRTRLSPKESRRLARYGPDSALSPSCFAVGQSAAVQSQGQDKPVRRLPARALAAGVAQRQYRHADQPRITPRASHLHPAGQPPSPRGPATSPRASHLHPAGHHFTPRASHLHPAVGGVRRTRRSSAVTESRPPAAIRSASCVASRLTASASMLAGTAPAADLSAADLSAADLSAADLSAADLWPRICRPRSCGPRLRVRLPRLRIRRRPGPRA